MSYADDDRSPRLEGFLICLLLVFLTLSVWCGFNRGIKYINETARQEAIAVLQYQQQYHTLPSE